MARGICRKWKQPVAYYFNEGGMKTDVLVKNIKEVITACQNVGLKVCDQGTANVAAINKLYAESSFLKLKRFGFLINLPHLLKGIRNNLYIHNNVKFTWKNSIPNVGFWILGTISGTKTCHCIISTITKKIKVSLAAKY